MKNIAKQQSCHKFIYKLSSTRLKRENWDLILPLKSAINNKNDIVALSDSQILRWICELTGKTHIDNDVKKIREEIKTLKKNNTKENRKRVKKLYDKLYCIQYQKDYLCVVMDSNSDYDRANKGFTINGYKYHRLLGTNGGIKKSTIVYIGDSVYKEIVKRMDNGRNKNVPLIPAKLEAYQALICSNSIPVTTPRILIVDDCNVKFTENVLKICDDSIGEPELKLEDNCVINYCDSDGYGLMSPEYSKIVSKELSGEEYNDRTISGINIRYAWTKGMLFTFDFVEFAHQKNKGTYMLKDIWGEWRDIRDYDVILTASMVKLWSSYDSLEHFITCCEQNHYQFSVAKTTPYKLENSRNSNYQFLQTYELSDDELYYLCKPTIDEIKDVLGGDWRKAIVFLKGMFLTEQSVEYINSDFIKALMIDKRLINDPFILSKINSMIKKKITMAAKGSIQLNGNFSIISGDLYSLAQSIFGLPVTGLLKSGEIYHKYWVDKNVKDVVLFRAPMTCHNNIRKRKVVHNDEIDFWYQYNTTGLILNSWDSTCDAANGADKDGDIFFTTNNLTILEHTLNSPTIECMQHKAEKIIPTEEDIIKANKLAFGDEIGTTTNRITAMIEKQSLFKKGTLEYQTLDYRIKCGQHYQQCAIDRAKGIIAHSMPKYWYSIGACKKLPENTDDEKSFKELCIRIVADKKPYFMKYVYPDLSAKWNKYVKDSNSKCIREFKFGINELVNKQDRTEKENEFLKYYNMYKPVGDSPCIINRISWIIEKELNNCKTNYFSKEEFDYSILKSDCQYSTLLFNKIKHIKEEYDNLVKEFKQLALKQRLDKDEILNQRNLMILRFKSECEKLCLDDKQLCNVIIDLCYSQSSNKSKQFAWDICSETIINNLLEKNSGVINYPILVEENGEFEFKGEQFVMTKKQLLDGDEILLY